MADRFQVLSLDGGGLKGVFTASFLAAIEESTGKEVADHFDLIAGTSTGGIIALGLGLGFRPHQILQFYKERGHAIFPTQTPLSRIWLNVRWLWTHKYEAKPLTKALQDYFGDKRLGDSTKRLIIPAFDSVRGEVHLYKTPHHERLRTDYREFVRDVALATASAPTYFPAAVSDGGVHLVDGGVWANNPSMVALAESLEYLGQRQDAVALLSIGTTHRTVGSTAEQATGGLWAWRRKALEFVMAGQSLAAENECFHILGESRFMRVNPMVCDTYALDRMSRELEGIGRTEARNRVNEIESMFLRHMAGPYRPCYVASQSPAGPKASEEATTRDDR